MTTEPEKFSRAIQVRWSDMDANRHLRHSAYYDYGAAVRIMIFSDLGLPLKKMEEFEIGPILFREEAIFKREIRLEDQLSVSLELVKSTADFSRWSVRHQFIKGDGTIAALVNVDGAWMDLVKRKLTVPPPVAQEAFNSFPKATDYQLITLEKK